MVRVALIAVMGLVVCANSQSFSARWDAIDRGDINGDSMGVHKDASKEYYELGQWAEGKGFYNDAAKSYLRAMYENPMYMPPYEALKTEQLKSKYSFKSSDQNDCGHPLCSMRRRWLIMKQDYWDTLWRGSTWKAFVDSIGFDPVKAHFEMAKIMTFKREDKLARGFYRQTVSYQEDHAGAHKALGHENYNGVWYKTPEEAATAKKADVHFASGKPEEAIALVPDHQEARKALGHYKFNYVWYKSKAARDTAEMILKVQRQYVQAENDEGRGAALWQLSQLGYDAKKAYDELTAGYKNTHESNSGRQDYQELDFEQEKYPIRSYHSFQVPENYEDSKRYPLLVYLHGGGKPVKSVGSPSAASKSWLVTDPIFTEKIFAVAANAMATQTSQWSRWKEPEAVLSLVKQFVQKYPIDVSRIYIHGISMGGDGAYVNGTKYRNVYAAIQVSSGSARNILDQKISPSLSDLKYTPLSVLHGDADGAVQPMWAIEVDKEMKRLGYKDFRYIMFPGVGHGVDAEEKRKGLVWIMKHKLHPENIKNIPDFMLPRFVAMDAKDKPVPVHGPSHEKFNFNSRITVDASTNKAVISWMMPGSGITHISVYSLNGKQLASISQDTKGEGRYLVEWDMGGISPGTYFYRINSGNYSEVRKFAVMK